MTQTYHSSAEQYSSGFSLALRMISVASGVTIGLFVSQVIGGCETSAFLDSILILLYSLRHGTSQECSSLRLLVQTPG